MTAPKTSILIFALYVFFTGNVWIAVRELRCAIYFGLVVGICLILIGIYIFIQTTFHLRFHPRQLNQDFINKSAVIVTSVVSEALKNQLRILECCGMHRHVG